MRTPAELLAPAQNVAIVIPTYKRDNIPKLVEALLKLYPGIHILVVDDRSPDGTGETVRALQRRHRNLMLLERIPGSRRPPGRQVNRGFAPFYRDGFRMVLAESWCQVVITMDADFSHDSAEIGRMLGKLDSYDGVVGSRPSLKRAKLESAPPPAQPRRQFIRSGAVAHRHSRCHIRLYLHAARSAGMRARLADRVRRLCLHGGVKILTSPRGAAHRRTSHLLR